MNHPEALLAALPHAPHFIYDWDGLAATCLGRYFGRMSQTPQDPVWHGEGDVMTHTRRVCEALTGNPAFRALPENRQTALALAALLHDFGKIPATRLEDGRWTSPGHGATGARMAREILWKFFGFCGTPELVSLRETVCSLVRWHMLPMHLLDREEPEQTLKKTAAEGMLAKDFSMDLLCMLAEADIQGRIADDLPECLDLVTLCRQAALEANCLEGPASFADPYTRRAYFRGKQIWQGQSLYNDTWGEVILLSGLPGTGKDTWIAANGGGLPMVSLDALRLKMDISPTDPQGKVAQAAQMQARVYLRAKQGFIWNATNLTQATRQKLVGLFEDYGAAVRIVYLETSWEENLRRNAGRRAVVPEGAIENMLGKLVLPHGHEAQAVEWICV